jgi:hypothetical protein
MRSIFKSVLVALIAVLALGAVAASGASAALPEFVTSAFPLAYSGSSGGVTLQTTESHEKGLLTIHCTASQNRGEISEAHKFKNFGKVTITYTGCKVGTTACTSTGAAAGEIVTKALKAQLVYTNKAAKEVGLLYKPEAAGAVAEYTCGAIVGKVKLTGGVISKLAAGQLGKSKVSFEWDYRQKGGIQEPTEYEEGATKVSAFLTSGFLGLSEQTGEEATETMTFSSAVEVLA